MASKSVVHIHFENMPQNESSSCKATCKVVPCLYRYYTINWVNIDYIQNEANHAIYQLKYGLENGQSLHIYVMTIDIIYNKIICVGHCQRIILYLDLCFNLISRPKCFTSHFKCVPYTYWWKYVPFVLLPRPRLMLSTIQQ